MRVKIRRRLTDCLMVYLKIRRKSEEKDKLKTLAGG